MLKFAVAETKRHPSLASLTFGRLVFIPPLVFSLCSGERAAAAGFLVAFVVADHFDGVIARRVGADGPTRRALDSISDRLAIWPVLATMVALGYAALPVVLVLAARDMYCARLCFGLMARRHVAIGADWLYRGLSGFLAIWVLVAPSLSAAGQTISLSLLAALGLVVAIDLRLAVRRVAQMPDTVRATTIGAGALRTWQPMWLGGHRHAHGEGYGANHALLTER